MVALEKTSKWCRPKLPKVHQQAESRFQNKISLTNFLAIDTEATGLTFKHGCRVFALSACDEFGKTYYWDAVVNLRTRIPAWKSSNLEEIFRLITKYKTWVLHNAVFDLKAILYLFKDTKYFDRIKKHIQSILVHDTMVIAHVLDSKGPKGLKDLGLLHLDISDDDEAELDRVVKHLHFKAKKLGWDYARKGHPHFPGAKSKFHKMDMWMPKSYALSREFEGTDDERHHLLSVCSKYAILDAVRTSGIFLVLGDLLNQDPESIPAYLLQLRNLLPILDMEEAGLHIIAAEHKREIRDYTQLADEYKKTLQALSGYSDYNPDSPDQTKEILYEHFKFEVIKETKTGEPSTDKEALGYLTYQTGSTFQARKFAKTLLKYRAVNSALKYLHSYGRFQKDWYIYPNLHIVGTSTTRLSSSDPNGQNVSKGKENEQLLDEDGNPVIEFSLRRVFGPPKGYKWYAIDYDQLQIRIFAWLSGEQSLIDAILAGFDFHSTVAKSLYGVDTPSKAQRKVAKYINFGIIFGAGERRIAELSGDPSAYKRFTKLYPNVASYIASTSSSVRKHGYVRTASGYPLVVPRNKAYAGVNYKVQGTEGDIVKYALANCHSYLKENHPLISMILQVHDEFLFQCPSNYEFPTSPICSIMEDAGRYFGVPCKAKPELIKSNWAEGISIPLTLAC